MKGPPPQWYTQCMFCETHTLCAVILLGCIRPIHITEKMICNNCKKGFATEGGASWPLCLDCENMVDSFAYWHNGWRGSWDITQ